MFTILKFLSSGILVGLLSFGGAALLSSNSTTVFPIDYDSSKWTEQVTAEETKLWEVDSDSNSFIFDSNDSSSAKFVADFYTSDQFETTGVQVLEMTATFTAKRTSAELETGPNHECDYGFVPWYLDNNNYLAVYVKYGAFPDDEEMNYHLVSVEIYGCVNGVASVDTYISGESTEWKSAQWHTCWADGETASKSPSKLKENMYEPTDDITLYVKKTRKTVAEKSCDSFYVLVNDYELNYGRNDYCISDFAAMEENDPTLKPSLGFYAYNTNKLIIKDVEIKASYDKVLPVPTLDPLSTPTKTGSVGKTVKIPTFNAIDNDGKVLEYKVTVTNPNGEEVYLESYEYFTPEIEGKHTVTASATDASGLTGTYSYTVKVKASSSHVDEDTYNDIYCSSPYDSSIDVATILFICVPSLVVVYIGFKVVSSRRKALKEKKMLKDDEDDEI